MENEKFCIRRKNGNIETLTISKIVFLALLTKIPKEVVKELEKMHKSFRWLKNVDV